MDDVDKNKNNMIEFDEFKEVAHIEEMPPDPEDSDDEPQYSLEFRTKELTKAKRAETPQYVGLLSHDFKKQEKKNIKEAVKATKKDEDEKKRILGISEVTENK